MLDLYFHIWRNSWAPSENRATFNDVVENSMFPPGFVLASVDRIVNANVNSFATSFGFEALCSPTSGDKDDLQKL